MPVTHPYLRPPTNPSFYSNARMAGLADLYATKLGELVPA